MSNQPTIEELANRMHDNILQPNQSLPHIPVRSVLHPNIETFRVDSKDDDNDAPMTPPRRTKSPELRNKDKSISLGTPEQEQLGWDSKNATYKQKIKWTNVCILILFHFICIYVYFIIFHFICIYVYFIQHHIQNAHNLKMELPVTAMITADRNNRNHRCHMSESGCFICSTFDGGKNIQSPKSGWNDIYSRGIKTLSASTLPLFYKAPWDWNQVDILNIEGDKGKSKSDVHYGQQLMELIQEQFWSDQIKNNTNWSPGWKPINSSKDVLV